MTKQISDGGLVPKPMSAGKVNSLYRGLYLYYCGGFLIVTIDYRDLPSLTCLQVPDAGLDEARDSNRSNGSLR